MNASAVSSPRLPGCACRLAGRACEMAEPACRFATRDCETAKPPSPFATRACETAKPSSPFATRDCETADRAGRFAAEASAFAISVCPFAAQACETAKPSSAFAARAVETATRAGKTGGSPFRILSRPRSLGGRDGHDAVLKQRFHPWTLRFTFHRRVRSWHCGPVV